MQVCLLDQEKEIVGSHFSCKVVEKYCGIVVPVEPVTLAQRCKYGGIILPKEHNLLQCSYSLLEFVQVLLAGYFLFEQGNCPGCIPDCVEGIYLGIQKSYGVGIVVI